MKNENYLKLLRSALATLRLRRTLKLLNPALPQVSPRGDLEGALLNH